MRRRVRVSGRVQGVWFRASLRDLACTHGVAGWVTNLPDGSVEAVLEGAKENVDLVVRWCRTGPPGAVVTGVAVADEDGGRERYQGFDIRY